MQHLPNSAQSFDAKELLNRAPAQRYPPPNQQERPRIKGRGEVGVVISAPPGPRRIGYENAAYDSTGDRNMRAPNSAQFFTYDSDHLSPDYMRSEPTSGNSIEREKPHYEQKRRRSSIPQSAWWKWSQARRASIQRQQAAKVPESPMTPSIIKARQESAKFVAPELAHEHLPPDILEAERKRRKEARQAEARRMGRKRGARGRRYSRKPSTEQWNELIRYWNHCLFVHLRRIGTVASIVGFFILFSAIIIRQWSHHSTVNGGFYAGLWHSCSYQYSNCTVTINPRQVNVNWQFASVGLMLLAIFCGFIGAMWAICGNCVTRLPRQIYFLHSSGEIHIVAGLLCMSGLIVYPISVSEYLKYMNHRFAYAYYMCWATTALYFASAFCLLLDELIRESVRPGDWRDTRKERIRLAKKLKASRTAAASRPSIVVDEFP